MSDLATRLRVLSCGPESVRAKAADLIEAQAARIAELERSESALEDAIIMADRYFDGDSDHADCTARLVASVVRMGTRIAELEAALSFYSKREDWEEYYEDAYRAAFEQQCGCKFRYDEGQVARAALNEKGEG